MQANNIINSVIYTHISMKTKTNNIAYVEKPEKIDI